MPPSYVLGDSASVRQRPSEVNVDMHNVLDFDVEYPEAEYVLGSGGR
jgi:hypothetical protein